VWTKHEDCSWNQTTNDLPNQELETFIGGIVPLVQAKTLVGKKIRSQGAPKAAE
jgi:cell division FtsZ-interacting protein ZapD